LLGAPHSAAEAYVNARGREWARLVLEAQYALRAARERRVEVVGADAVERGAVRESERHIGTLVGTVAAPRLAYQQAGHADLHPMDAMLDLPTEDSFSHGVRRMAAMESASGSFEEVVGRLRDSPARRSRSGRSSFSQAAQHRTSMRSTSCVVVNVR
jgi:hypothetical protein